MQPPVPSGLIGSSPVRVDGAAKVAGTARYGADHTPKDAAHAALVTAPIARGRITAINDTATLGTPGVLLLLTYRNVGKAIKGGKPLPEGGYMSGSVAPLASDRIHFGGQIVAVVVATTHEIAEEAARLLQITYQAEEPGVTLDAKSAKEVKPKALAETELSTGDFDAAYKTSPVCLDAWYETPAQVHNPMELFQSTCAWSRDKDDREFLTVWESAQHTRGYQWGLAHQLGLKPKQIRVFSNFVGGAFGSRGELGQATALIAFAARKLGKPVKWVGSRREAFTLRTFRAETRHHVQLGADTQGHLQALSHESWELTSRSEQFATAGSDSTARLYACRNIRTKVHNLSTDRQPPGFMRAPPETPYMFASESAMDELSYALGLDPVELRRRNETDKDPVSGKPYSSRSVLRCIEAGAEAFGWSKRHPVPRSMRGENGDLIGYGYATAFYPTQIGPADCRLTLGPGLRAKVEVGTHEIGSGIRTVATQTAADLLGLPLDAVELCIGDSDLPAAPLSAGSNSTASICSVIAVACEQARARLAKAAVKDKGSTLFGADPNHIRLANGVARVLTGGPEEPLELTFRRCLRGRTLVENATNTPTGAPPILGPAMVRKGKALITGGPKPPGHVQFAQGAQFVEVHVNPDTGAIRVARMVGAFAGGRIMNPRTANNQLVGGQVWGVGAALLESAELDLKLGRYANSDLAEYHIAVNADIPEVKAILLEEHDSLVNPLGIKGVGELGITGVNAAIANAVYHATGVRVRRTPIRPEDILLRETVSQ